jgi:predicted RNase H-like nuclease
VAVEWQESGSGSFA